MAQFVFKSNKEDYLSLSLYTLISGTVLCVRATLFGEAAHMPYGYSVS
jgi:hypothetical protein